LIKEAFTSSIKNTGDDTENITPVGLILYYCDANINKVFRPKTKSAIFNMDTP